MTSKNRKDVKEETLNMSEVSANNLSSTESSPEEKSASEENDNSESKDKKQVDQQKDSDANGQEEQKETGKAIEAESTKVDEIPSEVKTKEELKLAQQQIASLQDRLLRTNAEFENFKKRAAKENVERFKYYHLGLVKELLPALDSLERAIEHGKKENTTVEAMLEGIQMVLKLIQEALKKFSVSKINAIGEPFDPTVHQAVGTVESDMVPEDHVVDQFQVGYLLHDRVIRPAMVRVSKNNINGGAESDAE